jgi:hypothetical protein
MKYLKTFEENYNKKIADVETDGDWRIMNFGEEESFKHVLDNFYDGKEWICQDGDFNVYYWDNISWDKEENEQFWHTKMAIYIDYKHHIIKTKTLVDEPLYTIRDEEKGMTRKQELQLRTWIGTDKKPKYSKFKGEYLGMKDGFAIIVSPLSGTIFKIDKDGQMFYENGEKLGD